MPLDLSSVDFISDAANTSVESQVKGKPKSFYPLSTRRVLAFRSLAGKIASSVRDILYDYTQESGAQSERNQQKQVGSDMMTSTVLPSTPALSETHRKFRMKSIEQLFESFDDATVEALALGIMDSMRDDFPRDKEKPFTTKDAKELVDTLPVSMFVECAIGVFRANMDSFGPFAKKTGDKLLRALSVPEEPPTTETTSFNLQGS